MIKLLAALLVLLPLTATAKTCAIHGSASGFAVFNDTQMVGQFPSLYDANALKNSLIENHTCEAAVPTATCTIQPDRTKFDIYQGPIFVTSFWFVDDAAIMRDVMAEDGLCTVEAPTVSCVVTPSYRGFDVLIGDKYVTSKSTQKEADELVAAIVAAKVCR